MTVKEFLDLITNEYNLTSETKIKIHLPIEIENFKLKGEEYNEIKDKWQDYNITKIHVNKQGKSITLKGK